MGSSPTAIPGEAVRFDEAKPQLAVGSVPSTLVRSSGPTYLAILDTAAVPAADTLTPTSPTAVHQLRPHLPVRVIWSGVQPQPRLKGCPHNVTQVVMLSVSTCTLTKARAWA